MNRRTTRGQNVRLRGGLQVMDSSLRVATKKLWLMAGSDFFLPDRLLQARAKLWRQVEKEGCTLNISGCGAVLIQSDEQKRAWEIAICQEIEDCTTVDGPLLTTLLEDRQDSYRREYQHRWLADYLHTSPRANRSLWFRWSLTACTKLVSRGWSLALPPERQ